MKIIVPLIISTIAGLSTVLGGLFIFFKIKKELINSFIAFCLAFSTGVMIFISILDLIPSSSKILLEEYGLYKGIFFFLLTFFLGVYLIKFINFKIKSYSSKSNNLYRVGVLSMIALMLHNFPEGIATFMTSYKDINLGLSLALAIMMHNIPEGISIAVPMYYSGKKRSIALKNTFISGLAEPFGAIVAYLLLYKFINDLFIAFILIIVAGIMISLAINEIFVQSISYKKPKQVVIGLICGIVVVLINHFAFG